MGINFVYPYHPPVRWRLFSRYANGFMIRAFNAAIHVNLWKAGP